MFTDPNRIRELRRQRDWSQQTLAELIGVSKVTISDLELGKMALTVDYMRRIAAALSQKFDRVTAGELLSLDDNPLLPIGEERHIVEHYREADAMQKELIRRVAEPAKREDRAA